MIKYLTGLAKAVAICAAAIFALSGAVAYAQGSEGCLAAADLRDKDIHRHAGVLDGNPDLCLSEFQFEENGLNWQLTIIANTRHEAGPTIYLLHDNENAAFDTAIYSLLKYGGKLIAVEAADGREFNGQDPNRNFGMTKPDTASCTQMKRKPAPIFTQMMMDLRNRSQGFILTMHNNADGHTGNGGSGGISAARQSAVMKGMMAPNGGDEDDAILLAGTTPFEQDSRAKKATEFFHKLGINVIYEHVTPERNDCSFSNHVVLKGIAPYYNIEAEHGHVAQQKHMLDAMMKFHRIKVRNAGVK